MEKTLFIVFDGRYVKIVEKNVNEIIELNPQIKIICSLCVKINRIEQTINYVKKTFKNYEKLSNSRNDDMAKNAGWFLIEKNDIIKIIDKEFSDIKKEKNTIKFNKTIKNPHILHNHIKKNFGKLFAEKRRKLKISSEALGNLLGLDGNTIRNWECGKTFIRDLSLIIDIYDKTGIDVIELLKKSVGRN